MTRVAPGTPVDQIVASLSKPQAKALSAVKASRNREEAAVSKASEWGEDVKRQVLTAIEANVPVQVLADSLGVTRARIYQMRDEAREALV